MNHFAAKPIWNGVSWNAAFRAAEHGQFHTVRINGEPATFATRAEAESAAQASLIAYLNGRMRGSGAAIEQVRQAADALFPGFVKQKGKTRLTLVERRRA